jgi:K+-sensing histidine kinase KdpD
MSAPKDEDAGTPATDRLPGGGDRAGHLGYVAHEIRNPLSTALWTAELLVRLSAAERGGARGEKLAGICLRSVSRVRLLVEDHLLCERLDAGGYPVRLEQVPIDELLAAARGRSAEGGALLTLPSESGLLALADRALLDRALDGLLAVASADGAAVRVEVKGQGGWVEVRVSGAALGSVEDPPKGAPSDQTGRALAPSTARRIAAALGGSLSVAGEGYLLAFPAA